jgi:hypothetical protein
MVYLSHIAVEQGNCRITTVGAKLKDGFPVTVIGSGKLLSEGRRP